eukprot:TRINITY_DN5043_c0_g1_i1.p1 TRINITY_DN5043_c0_g1~~TRINITY_DN5043_c0_g1_i1.p1  ORF type:complete len:475 (+),score=207.83 TRINITY_DN5043_c0_g1_i1:66-1490(+)
METKETDKNNNDDNNKWIGLKEYSLKGKGLKEIPKELIEWSSETLESLDLSCNELKELPIEFAKFERLKRLFLSNNQFECFPFILNQCKSLEMIAFRGNAMKSIGINSLPFHSLKWLILTSNQLKELPPDISKCNHLQKLMLAGNQLTHLPSSITQCVNLQLIRISVNQFTQFPSHLFQLPKLSWLAYSGNPFSNSIDFTPSSSSSSQQNQDDNESLPFHPFSNLEIKETLGEGASGIIYRATFKDNQDHGIAVKVFKGALTSDGLPYSEMMACIAAGKHKHLIPLIGRLSEEKEGKEGLIMELIDPSFKNLAGPPSFETCTRDVYPLETFFTPEMIFRIIYGMADALMHLHSRGIIHGDFYGHNILFKQDGDSILGDFGAASLFNPSNESISHSLEKIEVRAFGCLLEELLGHCPTLGPASTSSVYFPLFSLMEKCVQNELYARPSFSQIISTLSQIHPEHSPTVNNETNNNR